MSSRTRSPRIPSRPTPRWLAALLAVAAAVPLAAQQARPDVVLILADDVGVEAFGCYGGESYATPRIDALAASGVRFSHCYSQPLCTPSRVKLMTGQSNLRNYEAFSILPPGETTFAHLLRAAGYATCVVGKWQLYGAASYGERAGTGTLPGDAGFDEHCLWQVDKVGSRYHDPVIVQNGAYRDDTGGRYGPDVFADYAIDFIRRQRRAGKPYLLYFPMALVHSPFVAPPPRPDIPSDARPAARRQASFAAMMAHMDAVVGRIVDAVDAGAAGAAGKRTLILFTGDNGTGRAIRSRCGGRTVRGGKGLPTDAGTHVPLVARFSGVAPAGRVDESLVDFADFLPTLCEAAGATPPAGTPLDGRSFLPQLRGEGGDPREWIFVYWNPRPERAGFARGRFARDREWKLYGDGRLYEIADDPDEERPIDADAESEAARAARQKLAAAIASMPEHPARIPVEFR